MTFDKERCRRLFSRFSSATRRPVEPLVSAVVVAATVKRKSGARSGKVQSVLEKEGEGGDTQKHITARLSAADGAAAAAVVEERGRRSCVNQVTGQLSPVLHLHHLLLLVLCSSEQEKHDDQDNKST